MRSCLPAGKGWGLGMEQGEGRRGFLQVKQRHFGVPRTGGGGKSPKFKHKQEPWR